MAISVTVRTHDLVSSYVLAKHEVFHAGYAQEIAWQQSVRLDDMDATAFVREAAWVVLSAGMSERVVKARFPALSEALHNWDPHAIRADATARDRALAVFGHAGKVAAILAIADRVAAMHCDDLYDALVLDAQAFLMDLPYIGPVTWAHLAKNLGLPLAKSDRHLVRLSDAFQRNSVSELCEEIADWMGEPVAVVDVVLWRYGALHASQCRAQGCLGVPHGLGPAKRARA